MPHELWIFCGLVLMLAGSAAVTWLMCSVFAINPQD